MSEKETAKQRAAWRAVQEVRSGTILGLGHGSTAVHALRCTAELMHSGEFKKIQGIPCSLKVEQEARDPGIPLTSLDKSPVLDLTIDGADQVDSKLRMIKGGEVLSCGKRCWSRPAGGRSLLLLMKERSQDSWEELSLSRWKYCLLDWQARLNF